MIKLKSLFRRGQGSSSSSAAAAATAASSTGKKQSNNNRNKSQSTTSLNSALDHEHQHQQQQQQQQQQQSQEPTTATAFTVHHGPITERAVDVGDEDPLNSHSHTLPQQKKSKGLAKKGHKQPKPLPGALPASQRIDGATSAGSGAPAAEQRQQQTAAPTGERHHRAPVVIAVANNSAATPTAAATVFVNSNYSDIQAAADRHNVHAKMSAPAVVVAPPSDSYELQQMQQQLLAATGKMQDLHLQMERSSNDKLLLETRVAELLPYQHEVAKLRAELNKMQGLQDNSQLEIMHLKAETESLRTRLRDVVNSPLSDAEKHQIIQDSQRLHSSAPASIALHSVQSTTPLPADDSLAAGTGVANDWDKHSSSSEISVACLQDKIIQMEETHYSTNEELQATLQELADLQAQLGDAHAENERLAEEKDVLFQSLCRQTEKLNETRTQMANLQELLLRDAKQAEISTSERERNLLDLIKTTQDERDAILVKHEELNAELLDLRQAVDMAKQESARSKERIAVLDSSVDAANAERKQMDSQLSQAKEEISQRAIEMSRLTTLLDNARSKIDELEQDLARGDKTDLSDVLDAARKEKDALEERVAELQDQCSRHQAEIRRLKETVAGLTEDCTVAKNNAKCAVSHLEYRLEQLQQTNDKLTADHQQLSDSTAELQLQCKCQVEAKAELQSVLSETQKRLADAERKHTESAEQLTKEMQLRKQEAEEWQQFQSDLLMTVRVANDFKTEALSAREQLVIDNKTQKERIRLLEQQLDKLNVQQMPRTEIQPTETQQSVLSSVQQEMAARRSKAASLNRQDSRLSVKTLIETIENNKQPTGKADEGGGAADPANVNSNNNNNNNAAHESLPLAADNSTAALNDAVNSVGQPTSEWTTDNTQLPPAISAGIKGPLREQQQQQTSSLSSQQQQQQQQQQQEAKATALVVSSIVTKSTLLTTSERKDPLNMLAKNGGSKRNALLKWCQSKTVGYRNIDITNFSSSWNDGLAFCAILHSYLPDCIPYDTLTPAHKRRNFSLAFEAAESVGIPTTLNINDMCQLERPDWMLVMNYITAIYKHFET